MGIKMPRFVVFWMTSTIKDEKSAAKFHCCKNIMSASATQGGHKKKIEEEATGQNYNGCPIL